MNSYFAAFDPDQHGVPLSDVDIRPGTSQDCTRTGALLAAREGLEAEDVAERHRRRVGTDDHHLLVAEHDGRLVAFGWVSWLTPGADGGRGAPDGWYLSGIVVDPVFRRRGLGRRLTRARTAWALERSDAVHFVVSASNQASLALHAELGFEAVTTDFCLPGVVFGNDDGVLCTRTRRPDAAVVELGEWRARRHA